MLSPTHPNNERKGRVVSKFKPDEDNALRELVNQCGTDNWVEIASKMPSPRNPRQCYDRWNTYLSPNVSFREWTTEEDSLLIKKREEIGPRWEKIAKHFNGRTGTAVKNRWSTIQRRGDKYCTPKSGQKTPEPVIETMKPLPVSSRVHISSLSTPPPIVRKVIYSNEKKTIEYFNVMRVNNGQTPSLLSNILVSES